MPAEDISGARELVKDKVPWREPAIHLEIDPAHRAARRHMVEERPYLLGAEGSVGVEAHPRDLSAAGDMDLHHPIEGERVEETVRIKAEVHGVGEEVMKVEEEPRVRLVHDPPEELRFAH